MRKKFRLKVNLISVSCLLVLGFLSLLPLSSPVSAGLPGFANGYVYSRAAVINEEGQYTWSEYHTGTGEYLSDIGVADESLNPAEWRVMSGDMYRSIILQKSELHTAQPDLELLSRAEYQAGDIPLANGDAMSKPPLSDTTAYVSILPQERRLINDPQSLIQAQYPVNPDIAVGDNITSILYKYRGDNIGQIHQQSTHRIGFKVAFSKHKDGEIVPLQDYDQRHEFRNGEYLPVAPFSDVPIFSARQPGGGSTDETGHYSALWIYPACPMFSMSYSNRLTAKFFYRRFNPRQQQRLLPSYSASKTVYDYCTAQTYMVPFFGPVPYGLGYINSSTYPLSFAIDRSYLSGVAQLVKQSNVINDRVLLSGGQVEVTGATEYLADDPDNTPTAIDYYDFDRDGTNDTVVAGHFEDKPIDEGENACEALGKTQRFVSGDPLEVQGVWLSSSGNTPQNCQPDLTRVIDRNSFDELTHQGLLTQISAEDLRNTDIYIVRLADGKLISERIGLNESEWRFGEDAEKSQFFYTIEMRGNRTNAKLNAEYTTFEEWQAESGINPELHQREADHLQPGDALRIFAINRSTGYIGHVDITYDISDSDSTLLGPRIDPIMMGPPNLRVRVERGYKIEHGITASDEEITQLVGFEGASLTSDNTVTISTEWLDHEGRPIPESMAGAGYTGRIAILSGDQTLGGGNQGVYQFAIEPGQRLQVLQLPNALSDSEHFYIHISGEPQSGNPIFAGDTDNQRHREADFSSSGQNPGILAKRPDNYVPFLVPLFDEEATELQTQAYYQLMRIDPEQYDEAPDPIYRWVYRPEMQFTSYDLTVNEIRKSQDLDDSGEIESDETLNILGEENPIITSSAIIDILYNLSTTELLPLDFFNAGDTKELVFIVGEQEVIATLGEDQQITFDDLAHLNHLSPDTFLSIRLVSNNDMGNTLWQWAFLNLDADVDSDNNNKFELPDRSTEEEMIERVEGEPGKILMVNALDTDEDGIPNLADFDPGEKLVPVLVQIPDDVDIDSAQIKFTYDESDPAVIDVDNSVDPPVYTPDTGFIRLWAKNGDEARNSSDFGSGGDYIRSEQTIDLTTFTLDEDNVATIYAELVRERDTFEPFNLQVEILE